MGRQIIAIAMAGAASLPLAPAAFGQDDGAAPASIAAAFERLKAAAPQTEAASLSCSSDLRQIVEMQGAELRYPCMLHELVEDEDDASMVVTLLVAQAPPLPRDLPSADTPLAHSVAAIGVAVASAQLDPSHDAKRIERHSRETATEPTPSLASFFPRNSDTFRAEVSRVDRERDAQRADQRAEERAQERAIERRREEQQRAAEYESVTRFLELSHVQGFCPADGRAFLARAVQYATSPLPQDRMVGLWADDRRHALEPYLNDVSRCLPGPQSYSTPARP